MESKPLIEELCISSNSRQYHQMFLVHFKREIAADFVEEKETLALWKKTVDRITERQKLIDEMERERPNIIMVKTLTALKGFQDADLKIARQLKTLVTEMALKISKKMLFAMELKDL